MGRKRSSTTTQSAGKPATKPGETTWANMRLTADDAPTIVDDASSLPNLCHRLAGVFLTGSDFSIRYNPVRSNYSAFIISPDSGDGANRTGISAFGPDVPHTLAAVLYKYEMFVANPDKFSIGGGSLGFG